MKQEQHAPDKAIDSG